MSVTFPERSWGARQCVGADDPVAIRFCNDDASIRREVVASLCSSLWLHAVLCALCFFRQKSSIVSLRELYRKEFAAFIARSKVSCCVLDGGMASWEFLLRGAQCCWLCACVKGLRVVANEESYSVPKASAPAWFSW